MMNAATCHAPSALPPAFLEARSCTVAGRRISYRECGHGPAVLLLHGIGSSAASWEAVAAALCSHLRVVAWDAPGYGNSDGLAPAEPAASDYAHALHGLVSALQVERFVLVGHSLGAMMAAAYAAAYPQHLHGLLLADPAQGYASADAQARARARDERVQLLQRLGSTAYAEQRAAGLLRADPTQQALQTVQASMRGLRLQGFSQACAMLANDDIWHYLPQWSGPLRVLCGDADTITPPQAAAALALYMGAPFHLLANAGHASYLDAPTPFAAAVLDMVGSINTEQPS